MYDILREGKIKNLVHIGVKAKALLLKWEIVPSHTSKTLRRTKRPLNDIEKPQLCHC